MIPKVAQATNFMEYRPISLCNIVYKIISNIISSIIIETLSKFISPEKFGFPDHGKIQDTMDITQECLYSIKVKNKHALLLKLYLINAHDRVDCFFLNSFTQD